MNKSHGIVLKASLLRLARSFSVALSLCLASASVFAEPEEKTVPAEHGKLIRAPQALGVLGNDLFGDKVNIYTGSLEFVQTDVSLPGNNALPVQIGRRLAVGNTPDAKFVAFKNWELDIPRIYGTFASSTGWRGIDAGSQASTLRCSNFGAPPPMYRPNTGTSHRFRPTEYWHGNMLYVPGQGEQEILKRNVNSAVKWPSDGGSNALVTRNFWVLRCLNTLASTDTTTSANDGGEGFLAIAPDGTQYRFDWLVSRPADSITKTFSGSIKFTLMRVEVSLYPSMITDRFGNSVRYKYDPVDKSKLLEIRSADGAGNPDRVLSLAYIPGTRNISSVTDGMRTWRYDYGTDGVGQELLTTVTLPDQSKWQLKGLGAESLEQRGLSYLSMDMLDPSTDAQVDLSCDAYPPLMRNGPSHGTMIHPSGATGTFKVNPTRHARNGIPRQCFTDNAMNAPRAYYPQYSDVFALREKIIEGPGIEALRWTSTYDTFHPGWIDISVTDPSVITVTDPKGVITRYSFGNTFRVDEGMLKQVEIGWNGSTALRTTSTRFNQSFSEPVGFSDQDRGSSRLNARIVPEDLRTIVQQDVTFKWEVASILNFDDKGRVLPATTSGTPGALRTETTVYQDDLSRWLLNRVAKVTDVTTGLVKVENAYNPVTGNLDSVSKFGNLVERYTYHGDGTLATRADERNPPTFFSNYKRGVPRNVKHSDGTTESAVVDNVGAVTDYTDQNGFVTTYGYDAMGRLDRVVYPQEAGFAWNETKVSFEQIQFDEFGLAPGHWRQEVRTGRAKTNTYYDALWRPVVISKADEADPVNTTSVVQQRYDLNGNEVFKSYPQRSYMASSPGVITEYDALGRIGKIATDSELGQLVLTNDYLSGFRKQTTDPRGKSTIYSYQAFDQPIESMITNIAAPEGVTVDIQRDVFGKAKSITRGGNGKSATRTYVYDAYQRLCKTIEPEIGATVQAYDAASNIAWRAAGLDLTAAQCDTSAVPVSGKTAFDYDARNRLKLTAYGDNSPSITRTYTLDGLPETISSNGTVWTYEYNRRRLNTREALAYAGQTYGIGRNYDLNGFLSEMTYPFNGLTLRYEPNALGQASRVGGYATAIVYHPTGAIAEFTYGNGIRRVMSPNLRGLPERATDVGVLDESYTYDENGNTKSITDLLQGSASRGMSYDDLDRLAMVSAPGLWGLASYQYDALDNLTNSTIGAGSNARQLIHTINPVTNRLDSVSGGPAAFSFGYRYDKQGNITVRGAQTYLFDQGNRMTAAVGLATYVYDGLGRRVSTVGSNQVNTVQVYSQDGKILYSGAAGGGGTRYIYLNNHQIAEVK